MCINIDRVYIYMEDKSTNINDILSKRQGGPQGPAGGGPPPPINTARDTAAKPAQNFAQVPNMPNNVQGPNVIRPNMAPELGGPGQGISAPLLGDGKKEFFGLKDTDYKSTIIVFALVLIFSSNIVFELMKTYLPSVMSSDNKVTLIGSLIVALIAALIYIVIKAVSGI